MNTAWPLVSVVIPMRNEASYIAACIEAVLAQEYPREALEVVLVDGDSDDGTAAIARAYAQRDGRVRVVHNPRRIVPTAMNIGIRAAAGDIIARVDGHTRIAPDYIRIGVETLRRTGAANVGGPMRPVGGGLFGDAVATAMSSRFGIGAYFHFGTTERDVDTVYLGMWPRALFERLGLFDEELVRNQDDELNYRIRKAGGRVVLNPAMRSWYQNRCSVHLCARQFYQYGEWKVRVLQKHPRQMSWRHFVPPVFVAAVGGLTVAALAGAGTAAPAGALAGTYGAGVLSIAAVHALHRGVYSWLATALAFVTIHVAWGVGFLVGLGKFADRWLRPEASPPLLAPREGGTARRLSEYESMGLTAPEVLRRSV